MDNKEAGLANPVSIKCTIVSLDTEGQIGKGRIQNLKIEKVKLAGGPVMKWGGLGLVTCGMAS